MKTASKLLSAAFALAAIASVAMPIAQPAEAASGPDLQVSMKTWNGSNGTVLVSTGVQNVGNTKSQVVFMTRYCGYVNDSNLMSWVAAELPVTLPAVEPGQFANSPQSYFCNPINGNHPVAARITVLSSGDTNTANNDLMQQTFTVK